MLEVLASKHVVASLQWIAFLIWPVVNRLALCRIRCLRGSGALRLLWEDLLIHSERGGYNKWVHHGALVHQIRLCLLLLVLLLLLINYVGHQLFVHLMLNIEIVLLIFKLVLLINELVPDLLRDWDVPSLVICAGTSCRPLLRRHGRPQSLGWLVLL
jgi:hypothetical protein